MRRGRVWWALGMAVLLWGAMPRGAVAQSVDELFQRGNAAQAEGRYGEAERTFRTVIERDPNYAAAHNGLGIALRRQGKLEEAIASYRRALQLDPNYRDAHTNLGIALYGQGKLEEAIASYRRALQLDPNFAIAHNGLGLALQDQGKLEEAIASYRRALQLDPNDAAAHNNLGLALAGQGKLEEAIASYRRALNLPEDRTTTPASAHTLAHNALGYALQQQGDFAGAIAEYERALALDPNFTTAQNNLVEARRQLAAQRNPQPVVRDDEALAFLPDVAVEPHRDLFRSTVLILSENTSGTAVGLERGSGWVVAKQGRTVWIVTNRHVVIQDNGTPRSKLRVEFYSGDLPAERRRPPYTATLLHHTANTGDENSLDLALLQVSDAPDDIQPLPFASGRFGSGSEIRVIGHPFAGSRALEWHLSRGNAGRYDPNQNWQDLRKRKGKSGFC